MRDNNLAMSSKTICRWIKNAKKEAAAQMLAAWMSMKTKFLACQHANTIHATHGRCGENS
jgi:hypothetical protein